MNHYLAYILIITLAFVLVAVFIGGWRGLSKRKECRDKEDEG